MKKYKAPSEEIQRLLKTVYDECCLEDQAVRQRQLRSWRRLKLLWEGFQKVWYSEVAHDWRIWDDLQTQDSDQAYYDKQVNVFRAYLESIIAALSVTVPGVKCIPDDGENNLDIQTAKAGDKISKLIYRHNKVPILWLHALFINVTEGMTAFYNYTESDESYGTYQVEETEDVEEQHQIASCPNCGYELDDQLMTPDMMAQANLIGQPKDNENAEDEYDPSIEQSIEENQDICPACNSLMTPQMSQQSSYVTRIVGITHEPKTRVCMQAYGGLYIKVPNYAKTQKDIGYLIKSEERDYTLVCEEYEHLHGNENLLKSITDGRNTPGGYDQYAMWARLSPQYQGEYPKNVVTENIAWIRPAKFNHLSAENAKLLKEKFPHGVKVTFINDEFACACDESLDDHWTLLKNPLADYIHYTPLGETLVSVQDITNDIISLVLQTIEHGIGQTFADPNVVDFKAYAQTEVVPGQIVPTKSIGNKRLGDSIYEVKTATLSGEVMPFYQQVQSIGQLTSGALPSLFGGSIEGSETASQYSMSRAQALQRLQNTWKMFCTTWEEVFGKVIPAYIKEVKEDEKNVQRTKDGGFVTSVIRKSDLSGRIGRVELEANENLPMTHGQIKDLLEKLLMNQNPLIQQILSQPENIPIIHEALGLSDMFVPGEQDVDNQYDEIQMLMMSNPMPTGDPEVPEVPSVEIDPDFDNHQIHYEICRKWIISEPGRQARQDNPEGYKNVLLHAKAHLSILQGQQEQMQAAQQNNGAPPDEKPNPNETKEAPITEESDVQSIH